MEEITHVALNNCQHQWEPAYQEESMIERCPKCGWYREKSLFAMGEDSYWYWKYPDTVQTSH